jgi:hypothetical protein
MRTVASFERTIYFLFSTLFFPVFGHAPSATIDFSYMNNNILPAGFTGLQGAFCFKKYRLV